MKGIVSVFYSLLFIGCYSCFTQAQNGQAPEASAAEIASDFRDISALNEAFMDPTPANRSDGIEVGTLGIDGGNKTAILALAADVAKDKYGIYDSFLIGYKGKLLFESYYTRGRINLPHPQASTTKGYTSLLVGRAIQLGYLTMDDLDKPLVSFLDELDTSKFTEGFEKISLHQALSMRGGLGLSETEREAIERDTIAIKGQGLVQSLLENSAPVTDASQVFLYGNYNPNLVMQVIEAVVPAGAQTFIEDELFGKLGISNYTWLNEISGLPAAGWRSSITSRAMFKLGILVRNKGQWNGEQLISEEYLNKAIGRILLTGDDDIYGGGKDVANQGYGYFWWNADLKSGAKTYYSASAQGGGGQFIVVIDDLDLTIVVTAFNNDNSTLQIIAEHIIPAFVQ